MKQKYTEELGYQPGLFTLAGWNLNSPKSVCCWALAITQLTTLQYLLFVCPHGILLYLCSFVFQKVFKRTPVHSSATLSICGFILCCILPIEFQLHQLPLLQSVSEIQQNHHALLGFSLLCFRTQNVSREKASMLIISFCFFSFREHNTVLKRVISCMLFRFLVVYDRREISLPLKLPTWLEA